MLKTLTFSGALLVLAHAPLSAQADDRWHYIGSSDPHQWFVDKRSLDSGSVEFPEVNAWVQIQHKEQDEVRLVEFSLNCRAQTYRAVTLVSRYNGKTYQDPAPPAPMRRPLPNTLMEKLVDAVCF